MVETIGDYEVLISVERFEEYKEQKQLISELKLQIEQLKKRNYNLKSLLLCKLPPYLNAIIDCL